MKAKIFICTHTDFECPVKNPVYEVLDARKLYPNDKAPNGVDALYYSELLSYQWLVEHPDELPDIVGFCHYRKYWEFMDDVPDLEALILEHGCISLHLHEVKGSVYGQYERCFYFGDMDIAKAIVMFRHPDLYPTFKKMLEGNQFYACNMFIMKKEDFLEMMKVVWDVLERYLDVVGMDLQDRILQHSDVYIDNKRSVKARQVAHQYRMGGNIGERVASAWVMWKFANPKTYRKIVMENAREHKIIHNS